jgi:hypothetical protein
MSEFHYCSSGFEVAREILLTLSKNMALRIILWILTTEGTRLRGYGFHLREYGFHLREYGYGGRDGGLDGAAG